MTAEKEVYIYPCQANTAMTIAVGDSCLLVSNAQAREMADRIYEVLDASGRLAEQPPSEIHKRWRNFEEFMSVEPEDPILTFARQVATIMKLHGFSLDDATMIVNMAKEANAPN